MYLSDISIHTPFSALSISPFNVIHGAGKMHKGLLPSDFLRCALVLLENSLGSI